MTEIFDPAGKALLDCLLDGNPDLEEFLEAGQLSVEPFHSVHPRLHIPSGHPTIRTPLTVELGGHLQVFGIRATLLTSLV